MFRKLTVLGVLAVSAATASAQQPQIVIVPGVMPAGSLGPGILAGGVVAQNYAFRGAYPPILSQWQLELLDPNSPRNAFVYPIGGIMSPSPFAPPTSVIVEPRRPEPQVVLAREFPATLSLQFPAAAEVWLDGKKAKGEASEQRVLTSPVLKENEKYTFLVKAQWKKGGKTYEAKRAITLASGDRSQLFIVSGDEVKE